MAINLTIQSTDGCFLKRFHHDGLRLVRVTEGVGTREREGHRSCWADSEVRSHSFILAQLTEGI